MTDEELAGRFKLLENHMLSLSGQISRVDRRISHGLEDPTEPGNMIELRKRVAKLDTLVAELEARIMTLEGKP